MWDKLCSYTLDVSKYILTGVVITSMFKEFADKVLMYVIGLVAAAILLIVGLCFYKKNENEKKHKNDLKRKE